MKTHTVIDGNAFYEIDEECYEKLKQRERQEMNRSLNHSGDGQNLKQKTETGRKSADDIAE